MYHHGQLQPNFTSLLLVVLEAPLLLAILVTIDQQGFWPKEVEVQEYL